MIWFNKKKKTTGPNFEVYFRFIKHGIWIYHFMAPVLSPWHQLLHNLKPAEEELPSEILSFKSQDRICFVPLSLRCIFSFLDSTALCPPVIMPPKHQKHDANERPVADKIAKGLFTVLTAAAGQDMPGRVPNTQELDFLSDQTSVWDVMHSPRFQKDWTGRAIRKRHKKLSFMEMAFCTTLESLEEHHACSAPPCFSKQSKSRPDCSFSLNLKIMLISFEYFLSFPHPQMSNESELYPGLQKWDAIKQDIWKAMGNTL